MEQIYVIPLLYLISRNPVKSCGANLCNSFAVPDLPISSKIMWNKSMKFTNLYPIQRKHFTLRIHLPAQVTRILLKDYYDDLLFHRNHSLIRSRKSDQSYLSSNTRFDFFSLLGSSPASTTLTIGVNPIAALVFAAIFLLSSAKSTCPLTAST